MRGDILFLVQIPLASVLASALVYALMSASHFLASIVSCEPVVGFLPNFHGYIIGT